ncbi:hypothetical protein DPMN_111053 [Dreissena polymorpha]|uniref:Uncharacterized protein n=1 Tax=Dreissena polymorpha TaxID=45954 RepID=A0A9D4KD66_DREPO|nr:hypothetical protein DPMN_111053 [Dreissena polymorpha]
MESKVNPPVYSDDQQQTEINRNTNELSHRNTREAICGRILRLIGDDQMCKACGQHLRRIGDEIYYRQCAKELAQCLLHELAALNHGDLENV